MISVVVCVKNRENERVQRAIDSARQLKEVTEVVVVDYCSDTPVNVKCDKLIRFTGNILFNKSHALNIGIKAATQKYIMTLDCDMILTVECLDPIPSLLRNDIFIINTHVRRIKIKDIGNWDKSWSWYKDTLKSINSRLISKANGGMQVFSKIWAERVHGYDENLILLGGPDNDMYNRAVFSNNIIVDINTPFYHQEHKFRKEDILPLEEQNKAKRIRMLKSKYLGEKIDKEQTKNSGTWGESKPNQNMFMEYWDDFKGMEKKEKDKQTQFIKNMRAFVDKSGMEISNIDVKW